MFFLLADAYSTAGRAAAKAITSGNDTLVVIGIVIIIVVVIVALAKGE